MKFKIYKNTHSTTSENEFESVEEALNFIKGDRPDIENVKSLRSYEKGTKEFSDLKEFGMPSILWNFQSNGNRKHDDLTESTGFIYFDIDKNLDYKFDDFNFYAYWKSISLTGYGALVRVEGVTVENFKDCYDSIAQSLGIDHLIDKATKKSNQLNILSYDPDLASNSESYIFDFSDAQFSAENVEHLDDNHQPIIKEEKRNKSEWADGLEIRYDNFNDAVAKISITYDENGVCDLEDKKIFYTQIFAPKKIFEGKRHKTLRRIAIQLLCLNPWLSKERLTKTVQMINSKLCVPTEKISNIKILCESLYKVRSIFKLTSNRSRRFFFEDPTLSHAKKLSLVRTYLNRYTETMNENKVRVAFADLASSGDKFTVKNLMESSGIKTPNTIKKHLQNIYCDLDKNHLKLFKHRMKFDQVLCHDFYEDYKKVG